MSPIMFAISEKKVFISLPDLRGHLRYFINWRPSSSASPSVNFYILIFFSDTTGPIETILGRNVYWMHPWKVYPFCYMTRSAQKKQEAQKSQKCVCIYIGINYQLFIFMTIFVRKSLSEAFITLLCNYSRFYITRD